MESLTGKVMLITGASTGIGAATARRARELGMRVALGARSADRLDTLAAELGDDDSAFGFVIDVQDFDAQQAFVQATIDRWGSVDVAFANAGCGAERGFLTSTPEHWREMILTNVYGCALTIRAVLPSLYASRGHAVLTSSIAGRRVLPGSLYSCTKFAVTAMGEALRQEASDQGVRVTLIEPGMTDTPFFDSGVPEGSLTADDIARAVVYAIGQPASVGVCEMLIRPTAQSF